MHSFCYLNIYPPAPPPPPQKKKKKKGEKKKKKVGLMISFSNVLNTFFFMGLVKGIPVSSFRASQMYVEFYLYDMSFFSVSKVPRNIPSTNNSTSVCYTQEFPLQHNCCVLTGIAPCHRLEIFVLANMITHTMCNALTLIMYIDIFLFII